jgi:hypothetical protein
VAALAMAAAALEPACRNRAAPVGAGAEFIAWGTFG